MNAPFLIVGATGMLGRAWTCLLESERLPFLGRSSLEIDLRSEASVQRSVDGSFAAVINCAAYTDVDRAENEESVAREINAEGVRRLVERCDAVGVPLVHYSTDYVFNGRANTPYKIDTPHSPTNAYGRTKAEGERHVLSSRGPHLLIRTSWVYAPWGKNFVRTIAELASNRPQLKVVADQRGRPTSAEHLASASLALLRKQMAGTFHVTDGGQCSWFELATFIAERVAPACRVEPCSTSEFPRPAQRPPYSVLDLTEIEARLGPMMPWTDHVARVLHHLQ